MCSRATTKKPIAWAALEAGADDFVIKPFSPRALVAGVRAILRRGSERDALAESAEAPDNLTEPTDYGD